MSSPLTLSRTSWLYSLVFGEVKGGLTGFPEPQSNKISLGLFLALLSTMAVLKPIGHAFLLLMDAGLKIIGFLVDGSYLRGSILSGKVDFILLKPWPSICGKRLSPWMVIGIGILTDEVARADMHDLPDTFIFFALTTFVCLTMNGRERSPAAQIAEAIEPEINAKLHRTYYKEPRFFPPLYFVD